MSANSMLHEFKIKLAVKLRCGEDHFSHYFEKNANNYGCTVINSILRKEDFLKHIFFLNQNSGVRIDYTILEEDGELLVIDCVCSIEFPENATHKNNNKFFKITQDSVHVYHTDQWIPVSLSLVDMLNLRVATPDIEIIRLLEAY